MQNEGNRSNTVDVGRALGGHTDPQLKMNIAGGRKAGLSQQEIGELIWQMARHGGFTAVIGGPNFALEVFESEKGNDNAT